MPPGQPVTIDTDAYPERTIQGYVASVQPGSGTAFSLLPPQNATGNWVNVRVDPHPSLYLELRAWL
jgi:membrane fusion protein (multidrug efflux system)